MATILIAVVAVAVAVAVIAVLAFHRGIGREIDTLIAEGRAPRSRAIEEADLERLPAPVQQWLRYSRILGTKLPTTVCLRQEGDFDLGHGWMPFTAEQYFTIEPPGFVWMATFQMAPMVSVFGRDAYRGGVARMDMRVLSLGPVAKKTTRRG